MPHHTYDPHQPLPYPFTYQYEKGEGERHLSPHFPGGHSGVTISAGYDLQGVTSEIAEQEMRAAGFTEDQITLMVTGVGLHGEKAQQWVHDYGPLVHLTEEQSDRLYLQAVDRKERELEHIVERFHQTHLNELNDTQRGMLFDFHYQGAMGGRQELREAIIDQDYDAINQLYERGFPDRDQRFEGYFLNHPMAQQHNQGITADPERTQQTSLPEANRNENQFAGSPDAVPATGTTGLAEGTPTLHTVQESPSSQPSSSNSHSFDPQATVNQLETSGASQNQTPVELSGPHKQHLEIEPSHSEFHPDEANHTTQPHSSNLTVPSLDQAQPTVNQLVIVPSSPGPSQAGDGPRQLEPVSLQAERENDFYPSAPALPSANTPFHSTGSSPSQLGPSQWQPVPMAEANQAIPPIALPPQESVFSPSPATSPGPNLQAAPIHHETTPHVETHHPAENQTTSSGWDSHSPVTPDSTGEHHPLHITIRPDPIHSEASGSVHHQTVGIDSGKPLASPAQLNLHHHSQPVAAPPSHPETPSSSGGNTSTHQSQTHHQAQSNQVHIPHHESHLPSGGGTTSKDSHTGTSHQSHNHSQQNHEGHHDHGHTHDHHMDFGM